MVEGEAKPEVFSLWVLWEGESSLVSGLWVHESQKSRCEPLKICATRPLRSSSYYARAS